MNNPLDQPPTAYMEFVKGWIDIPFEDKATIYSELHAIDKAIKLFDKKVITKDMVVGSITKSLAEIKGLM